VTIIVEAGDELKFDPNMRRRAGFTLIELIVVIGIVTILIGLLLPSMLTARRTAQTTQCGSNLRQLAQALTMYAGDNKGFYPPNVGSMYIFWTSKGCIGKYLKNPIPTTDDTVAGGVMRCPADVPEAVRCYSMNIFASGMVSKYVEASLKDPQAPGRLWKSNVSGGSNMILLIESFATEDWPTNDQPNPPADWKPTGIASPAVVGWLPARPAERFGYGVSGGPVVKEQFGAQAAQVCYYRHRTGKATAGLGDAVGKLNIAFADGHVQTFAHDELVDWGTGKSTYVAMWSPMDRQID